MSALRGFETRAIAAMAGETLDATHLALLAEIDRLENYEYTGCSDYATIAHPDLPQHASLLSTPVVMGTIEENDGRIIQAGFVRYLDPGRLTLECHPWGESDIPGDFRHRDVAIRVHP